MAKQHFAKFCRLTLPLRSCAGSTNDIKWSGVKVGQVLKVMSDEDIPADLLCLQCHLDDNVCFIKTTNLDGARPTLYLEIPYVGWTTLCRPAVPLPPGRQCLLDQDHQVGRRALMI